MAASSVEEELVAKIRELPPEKQQEVLDFACFLGSKQERPLRSLEGLWAGQGIDISEEDIAELRGEMWSNFPREIE
jgi:Protein of unknown function (DUF2281)